jgi:adenylate cyclase
MERKLTAILYADVAGYSRLTGADDEGTVETLKVHLAAMQKAIEGHGGRVVNTAGDAVLAEFASVVTALKCAVEAQRDLAERNKDLPENRELQFRVGVNLGDIVVDGEEIYGDGINVAARLESLADPGGICISGRVQEQVEDKLDIGFAYLGAQSVKNIKKPVNVYKILFDPEDAGKSIDLQKPKPPRWRWPVAAAVALVILALGGVAQWQRPEPPEYERASVEQMAFPLPDKPSIAVLPFDNLSGDPDREFLADGLTEEIITTLSKVPHLFVIARNSTFTYKGKPVSVKQVAEEQGVRYVLEGSVQTDGDRIRVNAQLIDALQGHHIWAERYDRQSNDLFALQDDITKNIMLAVQVKLTSGEEAQIRARRLPNVEAFQLAYRASWHLRLFTKEDMAKAQELAQEAAKISPSSTLPWQLEAWTHVHQSRFGWTPSREESLKKAEALAEKLVAMDDSDPENYFLLGGIAFARRQHDEAIRYGEKALALMPSHSAVMATLGFWLAYAGRPEEGIAAIQKAMRLSPYYPGWYLAAIGLGYMMTGRYDEAIAANEESIKRNVLVLFSYERLAAIHAMKGDLEKAKEFAAKVLEIDPNFTIEGWTKALRYKNPEDLNRELDALRAAGLPEKPPPKLPDKPSIAVLPFENMSGDSEQAYFADGMTDDLITRLSQISGLFVIARNSTFAYKDTPVKVQDVARDLGVRYVLEGSVRKAENTIRVNAQLIDAKTGGHLWAEIFDRQYRDIFAIQDEITGLIADALSVKLTAEEDARLARAPTENLAAYDVFLKAGRPIAYSGKALKEKLALFKQATELDPSFAEAYAADAAVAAFIYRTQWWGVMRPTEARARALEGVTRALALNPDTPLAHSTLGALQLAAGKHEDAIRAARKAVALAPNDTDARTTLAIILTYAGQPEAAITEMETVLRLDPKPAPSFHVVDGFAHFVAGQYERALEAFLKAKAMAPNNVVINTFLGGTFARLGRMEEAKAAIAVALKVQPSRSVHYLKLDQSYYKHAEDWNRLFHSFRIAGLPQWPFGFEGPERDRLSGEEIKTLLWGRRIEGTIFTGRDGKPQGFSQVINADGRWQLDHSVFGEPISITGNGWIEGDTWCFESEDYSFGRKHCVPVYRNPDGSFEDKDEYVVPWWAFLHYFSVVRQTGGGAQ